MLIFLLKFSILLIVSGIFIVQFYNISRYVIIVEHDGKEKKTGDVLYWWSLFWEHQTGTKDMVYMYGGLVYKLEQLNKMFPKLGEKFTVSPIVKSFLVLNKDTEFSQDERDRMEAILMCHIVEGSKPNEYYLFSDEPKYLFPKWIRKPISSCIKCMANPFGTAIWFTIRYFDKDLFLWTAHPFKAFLVFWLIFIICLSMINNYIYSKIR